MDDNQLVIDNKPIDRTLYKVFSYLGLFTGILSFPYCLMALIINILSSDLGEEPTVFFIIIMILNIAFSLIAVAGLTFSLFGKKSISKRKKALVGLVFSSCSILIMIIGIALLIYNYSSALNAFYI